MTPTVLCHADAKRHKNHPHHLGSIALNNMAVSLLERGNYVEALEAMKDSINLMKVFCRPHGNHDMDDVQGLLFQATHKCLHSQSDRIISNVGTRASATIQCRNLTHDLCDEVIVPRPTAPSVITDGSIIGSGGDQNFHVIYPIRIDECLCGFGEPDFESAVSSNSDAATLRSFCNADLLLLRCLSASHFLHYWSARANEKNCLLCVMQILLHNFALAYYCLGHVQVHGCDLHYPTHRHTAIHLWENAQDVLRRFYSCSCHKYLQPTACWVSIAVLHSFIPLLQHFRVEARVPPTIPQHQFDDPEEIDIAVRHSKVLAAMTETLQWCWSVVRKQSHRVALTNFLAAAA
jgi:hypothetical protein